jgi:hypothetical protein
MKQVRFQSLMILLIGGLTMAGLVTLISPLPGLARAVIGPVAVYGESLPAVSPKGTGTPPACSPVWLKVEEGQHVGHLSDVAALAANDIWAVGWQPTGQSYDTVIMHWGGQVWEQVPSPSPGTLYNRLESVAVWAADDAWAVGWYSDGTTEEQTLTLHWDGVSWKEVPSPSPQGVDANLNAVAVFASNDAWAVGFSGPAGQAQTLTMRWDGTAWQTVASPNPGQVTNRLEGISGAAANDIWAVGSTTESNGDERLLTLHWNGTDWQPVTAPQPTRRSKFAAVSALTSNDVWAVGFYADESLDFYSLTVHWDGANWTQVAAPGTIALNDVFVRAAGDAWAVGAETAGVSRTRVLHWDGATWQLVPSPNSEPNSEILSGVVALAPDDAWAVGGYTRFGEYHQSLMRYSPWCPPTATPTPSPLPACTLGWRDVSPPSSTPLVMEGVSAGANTWAVGYTGPETDTRAVVLRREGSTWTQAALPPIPGSSVLHGVAARASDDAWAVGTAQEGLQGLALHWDGQAWRSVPVPSIGSLTNYLSAVAVRAVDDAWAVGSADASDPPQVALIEHWDGQSWHPVPAPTVVGKASALNGVAISAADDAWAVGALYDLSSSEVEPLVVRWDGTAWLTVPLPMLAPDSVLYGVTVVSANDVWAVGVEDSLGFGGTLTLHWNGTAWQQVPSPNVKFLFNTLRGVSGVAVNDVWAVGSAGTFSFVEPLVFHWDGSAWTMTTDLPVGSPSGNNAVSAAASRDVWAVGGRNFGEGLALRYSDGLPFTDLSAADPFYPYIRCMFCLGIVSGYSDGTFRPGSNVTRGQAAKIIANAAGYQDPIPPDQRTFNDVAPASDFWLYVERAALHGVISGYGCGGPGEPCPGRYYRPAGNMTRGQLAKVDSETSGFSDPIPANRQTFNDVAPGSTFWLYIERLSLHNVISGYRCGAAGEPCPGVYFRPRNNITRGQTSKIAANTFFPSCASQP